METKERNNEPFFRDGSSLGNNGKKEKPLIIGTLNVKNIKTNDAYVCDLLSKYDALNMQEHWLFDFQLPDIDKRHTKHLAHGRAVDEDNPLPPTQKPRGYGGVALIYNKDLNLGIKKLQLGSSPIVAIEVCSVPPLCICNVYMPSRSSKSNCNDKENYMHCLDQLEEILNIYTRSHAVFILGDMNALLVPRRGNQQDVLLRDFVDSNSLCWRQNGEETFFHPNKEDRAEIDDILFNTIVDSLVKEYVRVQRSGIDTIKYHT